VLNLFVNDSTDLDLFFAKLAAFYSTTHHKRESLIIFDEVQQYPRARQLIKYLVADGRFDYLETGSLIRHCSETKKPLGTTLHRKIMNDFRQYILVGGMPQSVLAYINGKDFEASDVSKRRILKLYREGWGAAEDVKPYIDPVFENNVLLTQIERLTMSSRPKEPEYARNKNILVIGGSGSGKTSFFVKPNLMQLHSSYVVTDPNGYV